MITSCEFRFGFWDVTAKQDATLSANDNQPFAKLADMNMAVPAAFPDAATLEPNFGWPLDGTKEILPTFPEINTWGWWSTRLSGEDGLFALPPTLTVTFSHSHSSAGITLSFFATLPGLIQVQWYSLSGVLLAEQAYAPDNFTYFCECQVEDYGKIVITIPAMSAAYRFLRCIFIQFGAWEVLDGTRIQKAELTEEVSPAALTLPIQTLQLSFYTDGGRFSLLHPTGVYRFFQWKQPLTAYAALDGEQRYMGLFYLQEASGFTDNVTELFLVDSVGVLDTMEYTGGIYEKQPLVSVLDDLLTPEGLSYELASAFSAETISGYLPICTKREALRQIAFAIGAVIDTTRGDTIRIYPMPASVLYTIGPDRKIVGHEVRIEELVTRVDVTAHAYRLEDETRELVKTELAPGRHTLHFSTPSRVVSVTGASPVESSPNFVTIHVSAAGEVIVNGQEYQDDSVVYTAEMDPLPAGAKSSVKAITTATLVDRDKAPAVAQRVYDYYQRRYADEGRILPGEEHTGQIAVLQSLGGKTITGALERMVTDLTGGCLTKIFMKGTLP